MVTNKYFTAGFVMENGVVTMCAPILRGEHPCKPSV